MVNLSSGIVVLKKKGLKEKEALSSAVRRIVYTVGLLKTTNKWHYKTKKSLFYDKEHACNGNTSQLSK
jgi:hypothetical protein